MSRMLQFTIICLIVLNSAPPIKGDTVAYACYGRYASNPWCNSSVDLDSRIHSLVNSLTLEEKAIQLTARESPINSIARLGIPEYDWGLPCVYAAKTQCGETCPSVFPMPPGLAASFNMSLVRDIASVIGREVRSMYLQGVGEDHTSNLPHCGLDCWSACINIARDPRWGRNYEIPGEDPYLTGLYGMYHTLGLQNGSNLTYSQKYKTQNFYQIVSTLRHYNSYNLDNYKANANSKEYNRHSFNAKVSQYMLNDSYLPA